MVLGSDVAVRAEGRGSVEPQAAGKRQYRVQIVNQRVRLRAHLKQDHMVVLKHAAAPLMMPKQNIIITIRDEQVEETTDPDHRLVAMSGFLLPQRNLRENREHHQLQRKISCSKSLMMFTTETVEMCKSLLKT